jgi:hypothetical protein
MTAADAPPRPDQDVPPVDRTAPTEVVQDLRSVPPAGNGSRTPPAPSRREVRRTRPAPRSSKVVLKRLDPFSVMKVSLLFYLSMFLILLVAAVLLWGAAESVGVVGNIESFMDSIGFTDFTFEAPQLLRGAGLGGAVLVLAGTFGNVVMAVLYNLISDVVGGIKVTLGEDDRGRRSV